MTVRELRVTDIRCRECDAGPGDICDRWTAVVLQDRGVHLSRMHEFSKLAAEGWQWQEVDPTDIGARRGAP